MSLWFYERYCPGIKANNKWHKMEHRLDFPYSRSLWMVSHKKRHVEESKVIWVVLSDIYLVFCFCFIYDLTNMLFSQHLTAIF